MRPEILKARVLDTVNICIKSSRPKFLGFLSPEQSTLAVKILSKNTVNYSFFGGFPDADRVLLGCFPEWADEVSFPINAITFLYGKSNVIEHKDFLGSLMATGIKRETVGDILIEPGRAVVFVLSEITDYILNNITKIAKTGVNVSVGFQEPLPSKSNLVSSTVTVASERLDCVVAALSSISRKAANEKIISGTVSVNSIIIEKPTKNLLADDVLTIRGKGKFIIKSISEKTRKNRVILKYNKYN